MKQFQKLHKILATVIIFTMTLSLIPTSAFASGIVKASTIVGGNGDGHTGGTNIYYGTYWQNGSGTTTAGYTKDAVKYRVLANNATDDGNGNKGLLLLSDQALYADTFQTDSSTNQWASSEIRTTLNNTTAGSGFAGDAFSTAELAAINNTTHVQGGNCDGSANTSTEKIFLLSSNEATNTSYGFTSTTGAADTRKAAATTFAQNVKMYGNTAVSYVDYGIAVWWLRSPGSDGSPAFNVNLVGYVSDGFDVSYDDYSARAALNLESSSILFLSAAEGGKSASTLGGGFNMGDAGTDYAVTLKQSNVSTDTANGIDKVTIGDSSTAGALMLDAAGTSTLANWYSGANFGTSYTNNKYISAIISTDGTDIIGTAASYAKLANATSAASGDLAIGSGGNSTLNGDYTMSFYAEQANGDKLTDYAGDLAANQLLVHFTNGTMIGMTLNSSFNASTMPITLKNGFALTLGNADYKQAVTIDSTGGKIIADSSGTTISGDMTIGGALNSTNTLTLTGTNTITGAVQGGKIIFGDGTSANATTVSGSGSIANEIEIKNNYSLTANASALTSTTGITNNGSLKFNGGNIANNITGSTGTLEIAGTITNTNGASITQKTLTIDTGASLSTNGSALNVTDADITNNGTLKLTDTTAYGLANNITGTTGTLEIAGTITNTNGKTITQKTLTIGTGANLSTNGSALTVTDDIANSGTLKLTDTTAYGLANNITGTGTLEIAGTITTAKDIANATTIDADATMTTSGKITADVTINEKGTGTAQGALTLADSGEITGNIINNGSLTANADALKGATLKNNSLTTAHITGGTIKTEISADTGKQGALSIEGNTTIGAAISNQNITIKAGNTLTANDATYGLGATNNLTFEGSTSKLTMQAQSGTTGSSAINTITVGTLTAASGGKIDIDTKIANASSDMENDKIATTTATGSITIGSVNLTGTSDETGWAMNTSRDITVVTGTTDGLTITADSVTATSGGRKYTFNDKGAAGGTITVTKSHYNGGIQAIVQNKDDGSGYMLGQINTYSMTENETLDASGGALGQLTPVSGAASREFTINGNGYTLSSGNQGGMTVGSADTINIKGATIKDFATFADNAGTADVQGTTFCASTGTSLNNTGTMTLNNVTFSASTADTNITNSGTLTLQTAASTLDKGIQNTGTLNIETDTQADKLGDITDGETATGTTNIKADVILSDKENITQKAITIASGASLNAAAEQINATDGITNDGTLTLTEITSAITPNSLTATGANTDAVTLNYAISTGSGAAQNGKLNLLTNTQFAQNITNQDITVAAGKTITASEEINNKGNSITLGTDSTLDISTEDATGNLILKTLTADAAGSNIQATASLSDTAGESKIDAITVTDTISGTINFSKISMKNGLSGTLGATATVTFATGGDLTGLTINDKNVYFGQYKYTFTQDTTNKGVLNVEKEKGVTIDNAIGGKGGTPEEEAEAKKITEYTLDQDTTSGDLGELNNEGRKDEGFTINGNGHALNGSGTAQGILVNESTDPSTGEKTGDTLYIKDITIENFGDGTTGKDYAVEITEKGTVNADGVQTKNNNTWDYKNDGTLNFTGNASSLDTGITDSAGDASKGTVIIDATLDTNSGTKIIQNKIEITENGTLNNNGTITAGSDIQNSGTLNNNAPNGTINGNIINNEGATIDNEGTITGDVKNWGKYTQEAGTIDGTFYNYRNDTEEEIASGDHAVMAKADGFKGNIQNEGTMWLTGGTLTSNVTSTGTLGFTANKTTITGAVTASGTLAFCLDAFNIGDTIVDATASPVDLSNITAIDLYQYEKEHRFTAKGEKMTLISGVTGDYAGTEKEPQKVTTKGKYTSDEYEVWEATSQKTNTGELYAGYVGSTANAETKSLSEGRMAGAIAVMQGTDLMSDSGMTNAISAAHDANGTAAFASVQGSHGRYHTGSYIDLNSTNVAAGLAKKMGNGTTAGIFVEGGNSRYTSHNETESISDLRADGDINYFGGGIFARHDFKSTAKGNAYIDATFGAGRTNQDYASEELDTRYDTSAAYLKAHATVGYKWKLTKGNIDSYIKYLYTRQNGADTTLDTSNSVSFDAINSHRLRVGARYSENVNKTLSWYGGVAYEYEFDSKASADINKIAIAEPDLKGGSGMAELGLKFAPAKDSGWKFDAGLQGFTGKRDSLGVRLGAWYEF